MVLNDIINTISNAVTGFIDVVADGYEVIYDCLSSTDKPIKRKRKKRKDGQENEK